MSSGTGGGPPASGTDDVLVVDLKNGPATARQVLQAGFTVDGIRTLHFHSDRWLFWNGATCRQVERIEVEIGAKKVLEGAKCRDREGKLVPLKLSETALSATLKFMSLEAATQLQLPAWLPSPDPMDDEALPLAADMFVCANGLIDLREGLFYPPNPRLLSVTGSDVSWREDAACPQWLAFLADIFEDDHEQIGELQKWFGYMLTGSMNLQTALLLLGPPRAGKGTIAAICQKIVGVAHCAGPSLALLQERFGLAPLIGKRVIIVDEATLGAKVDRTEVGSVLRKLIAQDTFTLDRKHGEAWTGRLIGKLMLLVNELPTFSDASGALASRFLVLQVKKSHVGKEDLTLGARLEDELQGIFRWAVDGVGRLLADGRFNLPDATRETVKRFRDQMADVAAFIKDECQVDPAQSCTKRELYLKFREWAEEVGYERIMSQQHFGRKLVAAVPNIREVRLARDANGRRPWAYEGIRLAPAAGEFDFQQP